MPNHLSSESSPYLRQHLHNPVDWYPWGSEALQRARAENKPIFLSIGYSACHWCHVMEQESFKNQEAADLLNTHFVSIKVDREERPDLDELYMAAVQLMVGHGGWPMSLFLLPDGRPFYGGTYFPLRSSPGHLGFVSLLSQLAATWQNRREEVEETAIELTEHLQQATRQRPVPATHSLDPLLLLPVAVREMRERYDEELGGFGAAPKFPPHHTLRLLQVAATQGIAQASWMQTETLSRMALGGLYDHVEGGFHRYSTDALWLLPHFEKMLYDNALLARVYVEAFATTGVAAYARVAREICDWVLSELVDTKGGFHSSLDADSEGEEGKYYLWTHAEVATLAGAEWCNHFHLNVEGNYFDEATHQRTGRNIPHLHIGPGVVTLPESHPEQIQEGLARLRQARQTTRVPPRKDNKVITSWNGLMISTLATVGCTLSEPRYLRAAQEAAHFCLTTLQPDGNLLHQSIDGEAKIPAFLDDYAYLADGLLDLAEATRDPHWHTEAERMITILQNEFWDPEESGFFFTSHHRHETLIAHTKEIFDGALPSPNGVALRALLRLGGRHTHWAKQMVASFGGLMDRAPQAMATWLEAVQLLREDDTFPLLAQAPRYWLTAGESATIAVTLSLPQGWHIHPTYPSEPYLIPTRATIECDLPGIVGPVSYPDHFVGNCTFEIPIQLAFDAKAGEYSLTLQLHFQPCSESVCDSPKERIVRVSVTVK